MQGVKRQPCLGCAPAWAGALEAELEHLQTELAAGASALSQCLAEISSGSRDAEGVLKVPDDKIFALIEALQFEDRVQQDMATVRQALQHLQMLLHAAEAGEVAGSGALSASLQDVEARLTSLSGRRDTRRRFAAALATALAGTPAAID